MLRVCGWVYGKEVTDDEVKVTIVSFEDTYKMSFAKGTPAYKVLKEVPEGSFVVVEVASEPKVEVLYTPYEELPFKLLEVDPSSPEMLRYRYLAIRHPKLLKILRSQYIVLSTLREFMYSRGFIELLPPVIGPATDPGLRGAGRVRVRYYGENYYVMSSVILYKYVTAAAFGKVFFVAPNIREEPRDHIATGRHLSEFYQLDTEAALWDMTRIMKFVEELITYAIATLKARLADVLEEFGRDLKVPTPPFKVITYDEAIEWAKSLGFREEHGKDLSQEAEHAISREHGDFLWIIQYPKTCRSFYNREDPERPGYLRDFNLLYPDAYGEAVDGGEREWEYEKVVKRMEFIGEKPEDYGWFLEFLKHGALPTAGFGLGIERFIRYLFGLRTVAEATAFPKLPGVLWTP